MESDIFYMKRIFYFFNFCFYHCFWMIRGLNTKINDLFFRPLWQLDFTKRRCEKFSIENPYEFMKQRENNPIQGVVINHSWVLFAGLWLGGWEFTICNVVNRISNNAFYEFIFISKVRMILAFVLLVTIAYGVTWFFVDKNKKYLVYFRYFESRDKKTKLKNRLLAIFIFLFSFLCLVLSFWFLVRKS